MSTSLTPPVATPRVRGALVLTAGLLLGALASTILLTQASRPSPSPGPAARPHVLLPRPVLSADPQNLEPAPAGRAVAPTESPLSIASPVTPDLPPPGETEPPSSPTGASNAQCVAVTAPSAVRANERFSASVTFKNTGTEPWTTDATPHHLGSQSPVDNIRWGLNRVPLPLPPVPPGQPVTFSFAATAPAGPGTFPFDWRMVEDFVEWFGGTCSTRITVNPTSPLTELRRTGPAEAPAPPPPPASTAAPAVVTAPGDRVRIPAIGVDVPLVLAPGMRDQDVLRSLQSGVVRYPNGVEPGRPGVLAIAGHSSGFLQLQGKYRFAFINARKLNPGDVIHVDHAGTRYTYRVTGQRIIDPSKVTHLDTAADRPRLALISCWPIWTVAWRLIVDAELQSTAPS